MEELFKNSVFQKMESLEKVQTTSKQIVNIVNHISHILLPDEKNLSVGERHNLSVDSRELLKITNEFDEALKNVVFLKNNSIETQGYGACESCPAMHTRLIECHMCDIRAYCAHCVFQTKLNDNVIELCGVCFVKLNDMFKPRILMKRDFKMHFVDEEEEEEYVSEKKGKL